MLVVLPIVDNYTSIHMTEVPYFHNMTVEDIKNGFNLQYENKNLHLKENPDGGVVIDRDVLDKVKKSTFSDGIEGITGKIMSLKERIEAAAIKII